jgi:predicted PurR-regulated permease PerM
MTLLTVVGVVAILHFARVVLIPLALAILLAFLLAPMVIRLRHWGLGRAPAAVSVVLLSFLVAGAILGTMAVELASLAHRLPEYQQNVQSKVDSIRSSGGGVITRITRVVRNVTEELTPPVAPPQNPVPGEKPVPVEIRGTPFSPFEVAQKVIRSLLDMGLVASIVVVFVIFILIQREDLRDRVLRLAGERRINVTTQVLDDAARRVSCYLLAQLALNVVFGVLAGIGLFLMRIPDPFLWAALAVLLRYIPYLGIWVAAILPAAMAFAVEPGWGKVPAVFALYFGIDLLMYNFVEPWLYGSSTGVSPIAILIATVFWTWLWGPVGLLLATPLTVCVVVLGRYVPSLEFLSVMLSDEEVLPPHTRFYQRMLAMDLDEAAEVAQECVKGRSLEELYDTVIIPALSLAEEERHLGRLDETRQRFVLENTRLLVEDLGERAEEVVAGEATLNGRSLAKTQARPRETAESDEALVVCLPARDEADALAALMMVQLLTRRGIPARSLTAGAAPPERIEQIGRDRPLVACVLAIPPFGYMHARLLCRNLRTRFPELKLVAAILTGRDTGEIRQRQPPLTADGLATGLRQTIEEVLVLYPNARPRSEMKALETV